MAGDFYAKNSWDYLVVRPLVVKYLHMHSGDDRYPLVISDTQLYDDISSQGVARFGANRLFHCISRVLRELGYERRSRRGRTWDRVGELEFIPELSPSASKSIMFLIGEGPPQPPDPIKKVDVHPLRGDLP